MIDLNHINIGDEVIVRLSSREKVLGPVGGDDEQRFVLADAEEIVFARFDGVLWQPSEVDVIGHIPSMFGGDW